VWVLTLWWTTISDAATSCQTYNETITPHCKATRIFAALTWPHTQSFRAIYLKHVEKPPRLITWCLTNHMLRLIICERERFHCNVLDPLKCVHYKVLHVLYFCYCENHVLWGSWIAIIMSTPATPGFQLQPTAVILAILLPCTKRFQTHCWSLLAINVPLNCFD